jgi:hypothetical protein
MSALACTLHTSRRSTFGVGSRTFVITAASFVLAAGALGCRKPAPPAPVDASPAVAAPEAAVAAPTDLLVEGILKAPDALLGNLHAVNMLMPEKAGAAAGLLLHLPTVAAETIDGSQPAFFVVQKVGEASGFVIALPSKDPSAAQAALEKGQFERSLDEPSSTMVFESKAVPKTQVLGVRRRWLLAASSREALLALGPYATRTLPLRPLPKDEVEVTIPASAIRGPVHESLAALVEQGNKQRSATLGAAKAGHASAPNGVPVGLMSLISDVFGRQNQRTIEGLKDVGDAKLTVRTADGGLHLHGELGAPVADGAFAKAIASWAVGDAKAVLELPAGAVVAVAGRSSASDRARTSTDLLDALAASFPDEIGAKEKLALGAFLAAWDKARSDDLAAALLYEGPDKIGVGARVGAADPVALAKLLRGGLETALALPDVANGLRKGVGELPRWKAEKIGALEATVLSVKMPRKPGEASKPGEPETAELVWAPAADGKSLLLTAGVGARALMQRMLELDATHALGADATLRARTEALGAENASTLLVVPSRVGGLANGAWVKELAPPSDAILLGFGRRAGAPWIDVDFSRASLDFLAQAAGAAVLGGARGR